MRKPRVSRVNPGSVTHLGHGAAKSHKARSVLSDAPAVKPLPPKYGVDGERVVRGPLGNYDVEAMQLAEGPCGFKDHECSSVTPETEGPAPTTPTSDRDYGKTQSPANDCQGRLCD